MVLSTSPTLEHTVRKSKFLFKNSNSENYKIQNSEKKNNILKKNQNSEKFTILKNLKKDKCLKILDKKSIFRKKNSRLKKKPKF